MLLLDIVQAIHYNTVPNYSINEFYIKMPSSNSSFRTLYKSLLHGRPLPEDVRSREDGLLLLTALLADIVSTQRGQLSDDQDISDGGARNPYAPLTSHSEYTRMKSTIQAALSRWARHFASTGSDLMALYHFAEMLLLFPQTSELPWLAGYASAQDPFFQQVKYNVPEKAASHAWQVLDAASECMSDDNRRLSIWLPVAVYLSALVVWKKLQVNGSKEGVRGSMRMLTMFANELVRLPWPCCVEMAATLHKLVKG